jgi:SAM-dependent methyltransferase
VGDYSAAAEFYDLLYASIKDYASETGVVVRLIRDAAPHARTVLDVACGTGAHAQHLSGEGFAVDGVDLEPAFVAAAARRCPHGTFSVGDMTSLSIGKRYDVITCLFSAIGYAVTRERLQDTLLGMATHLNPGGVILIDPWFEPGELTDRWIGMITGEDDSTKVCRMQRTIIDGSVSRLEFEYLIGRSGGLERRSEVHTLGLFTRADIEGAFNAAGLSVEWREAALRRRGAYIGRRADADH